MHLKTFKGILLVALGAISYGILATIVKYATNAGAHTGALTFFQAVIGVVFLYPLMLIQLKKSSSSVSSPSKFKLILFGTTLGLTSCLYYLTIQYVPVSIGIILLMQSIWMSIVWEMIQERKLAHWTKLVGCVTILFGTVLATNLHQQNIAIPLEGLLIGLSAALSYTASLHASNHVEKNAPSNARSFYLILGSFITVLLFWNCSIFEHWDWWVFLKFGIVIGLFGTVIPPLMFTKGIPLIGLGLAGILIALEIPVSIFSAYTILGETVSSTQWLGVAIILATIILIQLKKTKN